MEKLENVVAFIATAKAADSRHFYESVLNFRCVSEDPFAIVFDLGSISLRIQKVESKPVTNHTVLGWEVSDIKEQVKQLTHNGVQFETFPQLQQDESGIWNSPSGALIAWFKDPDENTLSLTQL